MVRKIVLSLVAVLGLCLGGFAQGRQITGTVTGADGLAIIGATVLVEGTHTGTTTGVNGDYVISAPADATLVFSFMGYQTVNVPVAGKTTVDVVLKEDSKAIDDVIVVAFGTAKKEAFTGSAAVLKSDEIGKVQTSNIATALTGRVAGVQMSSSTGSLGSAPSIRVRGYGSINAGKEPLWVVDGMPYDGDLNNINPADIETMTVLKDAASNALYGARGANGVILVTTKRAKAGEAKVTIDAKWGVNSRALETYDVIESPAEYYETHYKALNNYYLNNGRTEAQAYREAAGTLTGSGSGGLGYNVFTVPEGQNLIGTNGRLNPNATMGRLVEYNGQEYWLKSDNWMDEAYKTGFRQEYNVNVAGSTDRSNFYASLGYLDNEGIVQNSDMERYTARLKADYQAKPWLKVGGNMTYAHFRFNQGSSSEEGDSASTANMFAFTSQVAPIYPLYIRDGQGNIMRDQYGMKRYDYGMKDNAGLSRPVFLNANAVQTSALDKSISEGNSFIGSGFADIKLYEGLKLTVNGSVNLDETRYTSASNPYYGQFVGYGGILSKQHSRTIAYNLQQILNYSRSFGQHNMDIMVGHESYNQKSYVLDASHSNIYDYASNDELAGAVVDMSVSNSYTGEYNTEGYFLRAQYDYDHRYFLSASYRRDASSNFHPDHRWGNFWSVGGAWLIDQESWFPQVNWINMLKFKASYGSQGNDAIGSYRYTDTYSIENNGGEVAIKFNTKGNPDITWETNANLNVGVEFGLFNDRLMGSVDFFNRKTTDMLFNFYVPISLGYSGYYANVGDMVNRGVEIELSGDVIRTKNVQWNVALNMSHVKNKVTKLAGEHKTTTIEGYDGYISGSNYVAEGLSLYTFYMRSYAGVDHTTGESLWYKNIEDENGKVIGRETTSDYDEASRYLQDSAIPDLYGGFSTSVSFFGVDISANFTYQLGGKVYDSGYATFMGSPTPSGVGMNYHRDLLKAWTPENPKSNIPRFQYSDLYTNASSNRFLASASYLNIQNINVGYTIPSKWTKKFGVESLRVYLACDNVYYWSKRKGLDPRQSFGGSTSHALYTPIRTISGGINVVF